MRKKVVMVVAVLALLLVMFCVAAGEQSAPTGQKPLGVAKWNVTDEVVAKNFAGHVNCDDVFAESAYIGTKVESDAMTRLMADYRMSPIDENIQYRSVQYESTSRGTEQLLVPTVAWYDLVLREIKETSIAERKYWCEIARIYEVDGNGERIEDSVIVRGETDLLDCQLMSGKSYEAEVDIFNDYGLEFQQSLSVNIAVWNDGDIYLCAGGTVLSTQASLDNEVTIDDAFDLVNLSGAADNVVPEEVYWIETKGEEVERRWEIEERASDEMKAYFSLTDSVILPETSAQTIVVRFWVE